MDDVVGARFEADQDDPFVTAVEGYYTGALLDGLHRAGLLRRLSQPQTVASLAASVGVLPQILAPVLAYLSRSGVGIQYTEADETYSIHPSYLDSPLPAHLLDQYIGAYGGCLNAIPEILKFANAGTALVDRRRHADAFAHAAGAPRDLVDFILSLEPGSVLDLGCGSAGLLRQLVERRPQMVGVGIDGNRGMLRLARESAATGTGDRLHFHEGDAIAVAKALPEYTRSSIDLIVAQSLANEFFGDRQIDELLGCLSSAFPDRILIIADYYGTLSNGSAVYDPEQRRGALHDIAQIVSGQGIPPATLEDWQEIYVRTGCRLLRASSIVSGGLHRFIHVVKV